MQDCNRYNRGKQNDKNGHNIIYWFLFPVPIGSSANNVNNNSLYGVKTNNAFFQFEYIPLWRITMAKLDNVSDVFANASVTTQSTSVAAGNLVIPTGDLPRFNQGNNVAEGAEVVYALLAAMHSAVNAAGNTNSSVSAGVNNTFNSSALTMTREFSFNTTLDLSAKLDDFDVKLDPSNIVPNTTIAVDPASFSYAKDTHNNTTNISTVTKQCKCYTYNTPTIVMR